MDCIAACLVLALLAPLWPPLYLTLWAAHGRPVLFCQARAGRNGRRFTCLKLRTMRPAGPAEQGPAGDAGRLGRLGWLLRATGLDELPQLLNILRGEMSWVGPRPLLPAYLPRYDPLQATRHAVLPGLTGWAQVHGRNALSWERRLALDAEYAARWTLGLDARIVWMTLAQLARPAQAAAAAGRASMPEFLGSAGAGR